MTWALRSLCRPSAKSALTHHRHRLVVVWPAAIVRPSGAGVAPLPVLPCRYIQQTPTAACASDAAAPITGGLGASATNKQQLNR